MNSITAQLSDARAGPPRPAPDLPARTVTPTRPVTDQPAPQAAAQPANSVSPATIRRITVDLPAIEAGKLQLSVDDETGRVVGRVIDRQTGELLWQMPSDDTLRMIAATDELLGPLYSTEA